MAKKAIAAKTEHVGRTRITYATQPSKRPKGERGIEGIQIGEIPSNTIKGKTYEILLDDNNMVFCTCDGWFFRHRCSHLEAFRKYLTKRASGK